jgi:hypothetical protein
METVLKKPKAGQVKNKITGNHQLETVALEMVSVMA